MNYAEQIQKDRDEKDHLFKTHPHSPLTDSQKAHFSKLNYFPVDEDLRFELEIQEFKKKEKLDMQTNTGEIQHYIDFGKVEFTVDGKKTELHVYKNNTDPDYYFVPFWDMTVKSGETYGAGRYLELHKTQNGKFILDFNVAYNPYCAYNERWSCPLTPPDNRLKVRIEAGEKKFK